MERLTKMKEGKKKEAKVKPTGPGVAEAEAETGADFVTQVHARNDLTVDYSIVFNVRERLDFLKKERIKGKFSADYHVQVMNLMVNHMPDKEELDITLKVEVLILLVGTLFQTAKQG